MADSPAPEAPRDHVAFTQIGVRDDALHVQIGEKASWVIFAPGGRDAIAHWMTFRLGEAGARRRIFSLQTDGDSSSHRVRGRNRAGISEKHCPPVSLPSGTVQTEIVGTSHPLRYFAEKMVSISDNTE